MEVAKIILPQVLKNKIILILILLIGLSLRLHYFSGIDFDGTGYTLAAKSIVEGVYDPTDLNGWNQGTRFGMILPIALMYSFFGVSDISTFFFQMAISLLQIVLIYYLGKVLFSERVGLVAAFLLAIFPLDVNNASIIEADIFISFFSGLIVLLFYKGEKENKAWMLIVSGILFGIAIFTKIFAGLLVIVYTFYSFIYVKNWKRIRKNTLLLLSGTFLIVIPTMTYFYVSVHDPFYFYTVEKLVNDSLLDSGILDLAHYPSRMLLLDKSPDPPMFSVYFLFVIPAIFYWLRKKNESANILLYWLIPILLILMLYPDVPKIQRYLIFIEIPLILLIASGLEQLYASLKEKVRIILVVLLIFLLVIISFQQYGGYGILNRITYLDDEKITRPEEFYFLLLNDLPPKDIYI